MRPKLKVPVAMRSASIAGTAFRAASRSSASVTSGKYLREARSTAISFSSRAFGRLPYQRRWVISSKLARGAISSTAYPAKMSFPASPSTRLNRVAAATTPSSPLCFSNGIFAVPLRIWSAVGMLSILIVESTCGAGKDHVIQRALHDRTTSRRDVRYLSSDALLPREPGHAALRTGHRQVPSQALSAG